MIGITLGHYKITAKLGEGGMGVVYRATDTKLGRDVALKVLPAAVANDSDRLGRFEREARTLASLNHPNIAAIYGVEQGALVMELVEGADLKGPLPADTVIQYACQIADALEAAHERGIIHRDLKPANIKITADGVIKLLDFGLAKAIESRTLDPENSPTLTMGASVSGVIMGTAAYMSPEQARGARVDHRTDIWAFGVVLYEIATGKRMFGGETVSDILAAVLRADISIDQAPAVLQPLLARCLEREPRRRLGWIGEARALLVAQPAPPRQRRLWPAVAAAAVLAAAAGYFGRQPTAPPPLPLFRFSFAPKDLAEVIMARNEIISPDGKLLAYVAGDAMWVRDMESGVSRQLAGTTGALGPFWSADSTTIGYFAGQQYWKIASAGGAPVAVYRPNAVGAAGIFSADGQSLLLNAGKAGWVVVPASGGPAVHGSNANTLLDVAGASPLPDRKGERWFVQSTGGKLMAKHWNSEEAKEFGTGLHPYYSPTGHLVFEDAGRIVAAPFSAADLQFTGPAVTIAESGGKPAVSNSAVLVFRGRPSESNKLVIRDRQGKEIGIAGTSQPGIQNIEVSPDGLRIATESSEQGNPDIWIHERDRPLKTRLTSSPGAETRPVWSPDGSRVVYASTRKLYIVDAGGARPPVAIEGLPDTNAWNDWSPDGQTLLHHKILGADSSNDTGYARLSANGARGEHHDFLPGPFDESFAKFSRDGRFVAYTTNESGTYEIMVRSFPSGAAKWRISTKGGVQPRWSRNGKEIFYLENGVLMAAPFSVRGNELIAGTPVALFNTGAFGAGRTTRKYDELPDGRFVILERESGPDDDSRNIHVIVGWTALLNRAK